MEKINVFLDDIRTPEMSHNEKKGLGVEYSEKNKWVIIRDYFSFIEFLDKNLNDIRLISFDHDIASYKNGREYTGKDAANYLIELCLDNKVKMPKWYVHSDNTVGAFNINSILENYVNVIES
jgi:hypothetical protein